MRYFHGCYSVGDDTLWGVNRRRKSAAGLSAYKGADIRHRARNNEVELCFTPTYASWANSIEAHFGPVRRFTIANSEHPNHTVQTRALHAYLRRRNANVRHYDVLAAERGERARIRSEKGIRWADVPSRPQRDRTSHPVRSSS